MSGCYDAVVIGAGMGGIYQAYRLLKLGLTVRVFDRAGGPGGTWYWNRYPGAMSDTHSLLYRYSWDKEDLQSYPWAENYLDSGDILTYLNHVVDRHNLRQYMQFHTEVRSMRWNDEQRTWTIRTSGGDFIAQYVVTAVGLLSEPNWPSIAGLASFKGELYHTARWPDSYDFSGKKVGVIGNGSTGVQLITAIAPKVGSLLCFQRHPQYSVPAGRKPVSKEERDAINQKYDDIWARARQTFSGGGIDEAKIKTTEVSSEERERIYQELWDQGSGIRFLMGSFTDITIDEVANKTACDFIKAKIAQIVQDPEKRRKLTPKELYARRPICDTGYYEQFNRDNVDIVDIMEHPIAEVTSNGIKLVDGTFHELDVLICATGFNAFDGAYRRIRIEGRGGLTLNEHWKNGPTTNMGVAVAGFPNLFMILGPKSPLANVPPMLEAHVDFITSAIMRAQEQGKLSKTAIESTKQGEDEWGALCDTISDKMLFKKIDSYFYGANVQGKLRSTLIFFGGLAMFSQKLQDCIDHGYPSFTFH
ncbi:uncharacterized protein Z520_00592 [Fonsecaea multimorphosa CBS 102226]|uniref:FAD/NAD(P)-binding domain-containing protein n=1 Tax=Fonsecaea multimorphosa CBS 102226 TaxID=1442371 RepID=A0A0D2KKD0_9EURO|nr:uncharacterized protein Z520_00592 [Fonsecaea multimorphosa CBS 102226]KIY03900.1 hypothetical protein Z520_00592 [Fonsecaea multimorphosa CBS 102226]OAL32161.1 hypothetical protein AYO22_00611 [Fonsecaea multimorphosa]